MPVQKVAGGRLWIRKDVHYQAPEEQPINIESSYRRMLKSGEQPYIRKLKLTNKWERLDPAWITEASLFLIINSEGRNFSVYPTKEQAEAIERRVIEVCFAMKETPVERLRACCLVRPRESLPAEPADVQGVWLRCRTDEAQCMVCLFPV